MSVHAFAPVFSHIVGQSRVKTFLEQAVAEKQISHAYLFVGPPGSGKTDAAYALAAAALCAHGGCGECDSCVRVARRTHPDVHYCAPEGSGGYMIGQIREIVHDVGLAPVRGTLKVYLLDWVDLLSGAPANAFLKTLEEPPDDALFILLGRTRDTILPTILSRCQVVPFRTLPRSEACALLTQMSGATEQQASIALAACAGSLTRACEFLHNSKRMAVREEVLAVFDRLPDADDLDILNTAKVLLDATKAPLADVRDSQAKQTEKGADYLSKSALRALEERQKRELTAREREGMFELFALLRSWLRDCLTLASGASNQVIGGDDLASLKRMAALCSPAALVRAIGCVDAAQANISYNVTPQLVIETMLFDIREVLICPE